MAVVFASNEKKNLVQWGMLQRMNAKTNSFYQYNQDATTNTDATTNARGMQSADVARACA
jgi:hypothetical protein